MKGQPVDFRIFAVANGPYRRREHLYRYLGLYHPDGDEKKNDVIYGVLLYLCEEEKKKKPHKKVSRCTCFVLLHNIIHVLN